MWSIFLHFLTMQKQKKLYFVVVLFKILCQFISNRIVYIRKQKKKILKLKGKNNYKEVI